MIRNLLVTNDFPPKIGGIQNYLWELWRRLPDGAGAVYTTPYRGAAEFDATQPYPIERSPEPWLAPYPWLIPRIRRLAEQTGAELVMLDPAVPLGVLGPNLGLPYAVILHGAEVTIPGHLPGLRPVLARTLRSALLVVSAGEYALREAERCVGRRLPSVVVPPGVDSDRFRPADRASRISTRRSLGVADDTVLLATVSRLVPRKGMETLVRAAAKVSDRRRRISSGPDLVVFIGGRGREERSLRSLAERLEAPVRLPGRLTDEEVVDLYGAADLMAMVCNERWFGLEQEGFGIVFLEAAAAGLPQIAGRSGGSHEAVEHRRTGLIVDAPTDVGAVATAIEQLMDDEGLRRKMGEAARVRAVESFDYGLLADRLQRAIERALTGGDEGLANRTRLT